MAALLLTSCGILNGDTVVEPRPCQVPPVPDPPVTKGYTPCPEDAVCLTPDDAVDLGLYIREVRRVKEALLACNLVTNEGS